MIGILFATEMEAQPFLDRGEPENTVIAISGMGQGAARTAALELIKNGATTIINAGVCGALADDIERGQVFMVSEVFNVDGASLGTPELGEGGSSVALVQNLPYPPKRLVTVDKPVFQPERKKALSKMSDLVDMEGFSVAQVCAEKNISCIMLKGVTDFGDHNGKEDIQKHIAPVSESVADAVLKVINEASCFVVVDQEAPSTLKKLHSFTKIEHTVFSLPLLFAGAWIGAGGAFPPVAKLLLIALVGLGARTFGMAVNRILDKDIDAENPRTKNRELPSGKLSIFQGYGVALFGIVLYFLGCALLGTTVLKLSLVPLIPLTVYSLLKRFTPLCHYGIGVCLAMAPMGAFVAVTNSIQFPLEAWLLALFTFCWISGFDMIYALMDIDFDRAHGIRSIPAALGARKAEMVAAGTHLISIAALLLLVDGILPALAASVSVGAYIAAYLPLFPVHVRFFPISAIAGIAGALVVLLGG